MLSAENRKSFQFWKNNFFIQDVSAKNSEYSHKNFVAVVPFAEIVLIPKSAARK